MMGSSVQCSSYRVGKPLYPQNHTAALFFLEHFPWTLHHSVYYVQVGELDGSVEQIWCLPI